MFRPILDWFWESSLPLATCASATGALLASDEDGANTRYSFAAVDRIFFRVDVSAFSTVSGFCADLERTGSPVGSVFPVLTTGVATSDAYGDPAPYEGAEYDISAVSTATYGSSYWFPLSVDVSSLTTILIGLEKKVEGAAWDGSNYIGWASENGGADYGTYTATFPSTSGSIGIDLQFKLYGTAAGDADATNSNLSLSLALNI